MGSCQQEKAQELMRPWTDLTNHNKPLGSPGQLKRIQQLVTGPTSQLSHLTEPSVLLILLVLKHHLEVSQ